MSVQLSAKYDPINPDHIYYNLSTINNNIGNKTHRLRFNENRSSPYVPCANDYYLSVVRFEILSPSLPFMIPQIDLSQYGTDKTEYYITLKYGSSISVSQLIYTPTNNTIQRPALTDGILSNDYYYMYNPKELVKMINQSLINAVQDIGEALPVGSKPPFIMYDEVTQLFSMCGQKTLISVPVVATGNPIPQYLEIFFSHSLHNILAFPNSIYDTTIIQQEYKIMPIDHTVSSYLTTAYNYGTPTDTVDDFIKLTQDYSSLPLMNPIQSIVFTSNTIPVIPDITTNSISYGIENIPGNQNNTNIINFSNIITDFSVPYSTGNTYKNSISYEPTVYRLIDLYGMSPLYNIEIECYWQDRYNNLYPLILINGTSSSLKLMFRKKNLLV